MTSSPSLAELSAADVEVCTSGPGLDYDALATEAAQLRAALATVQAQAAQLRAVTELHAALLNVNAQLAKELSSVENLRSRLDNTELQCNELASTIVRREAELRRLTDRPQLLSGDDSLTGRKRRATTSGPDGSVRIPNTSSATPTAHHEPAGPSDPAPAIPPATKANLLSRIALHLRFVFVAFFAMFFAATNARHFVVESAHICIACPDSTTDSAQHFTVLLERDSNGDLKSRVIQTRYAHHYVASSKRKTNRHARMMVLRPLSSRRTVRGMRRTSTLRI